MRSSPLPRRSRLANPPHRMVKSEAQRAERYGLDYVRRIDSDVGMHGAGAGLRRRAPDGDETLRHRVFRDTGWNRSLDIARTRRRTGAVTSRADYFVGDRTQDAQEQLQALAGRVMVYGPTADPDVIWHMENVLAVYARPIPQILP